MDQKLHNNLIEIIRGRIPHGENLANLLSDMLYIGKEAAYRRLRGEVPFTFDEVAILSKAMDISIDEIIGMTSAKSKPFQLKLTRHVNLTEPDYAQMEECVNMLKSSRNCSYREYGASASILPMVFFLKHSHISRFFMLRWLYQWEGIGSVKSLDDIKVPARLEDIRKRYMEESSYVNYSYYIWDKLVLFYLINDINCFSEISFISKDDVAALKEELLKFVDEMENLATKGHTETGSKVEFFLSTVNFENTYSYFETDFMKLSYVKAFTLNGFASLDTSMFDRLKSWIVSLKRLSILISESGEMQRYQFIKEQRDLINNSL